MKILVTGAAGFVGGRTAKHLASIGHNVVATSRRRDREAELIAAGCTFRAGDLADAAFTEAITKEIDVVVHCAALSSPWGIYDDFFKSNVLATQNLCQAAQKNGVTQFVFISTPSIYLTSTDRLNVSESDPVAAPMANHYAATKWIAEKYVLAQNSAGFKTLALRPRAVIGAEDTVIFPRLIRSYHEGKLKVIGDGNNTADLTCVRNVIEAVLCALNAPDEAWGEAYNVSDGAPVKLWDAVNYILQHLGYPRVTSRIGKPVALAYAGLVEHLARWFTPRREPALTRYSVRVLSQSLTLDISKARNLLRYQPVQSTMEGINEFIEWYREKK